MQVDTDEPELIERVAALDVGKAEVVCCSCTRDRFHATHRTQGAILEHSLSNYDAKRLRHAAHCAAQRDASSAPVDA
jgi:hypothetical protein